MKTTQFCISMALQASKMFGEKTKDFFSRLFKTF
jgi:hypothetical protein